MLDESDETDGGPPPGDEGNGAAPRRQRGIQSIEVGLRVLQALTEQRRPLPLKDIGRLADMAPAKAHPYLVSFMQGGLVKQNPLTGHYELGPGALQLGLAALQQLDPLTEASQEAAQLAAASDLSIALAVWGQLGPTVVRLDEPRYPLHVNLRVGTVMSLFNTITGRVFAAYLPEKMVRSMLEDEHRRVVGGTSASFDAPEVQALLSEIRATGMGRGVSMPQPGVNTLCAPVFDAAGHIALVMTMIGPQGVFDAEIDSAAGELLRQHARRTSLRLGHSVLTTAIG
ncbi:MAG: IclR family transcriptional regulator [Ottowia sp.]|nr:IclR family transcriptional regulator [Ottowia sp.]MBP7454966.1 IclR family transcriptional regulator [Ottowia sp.]MBP8860611.1 IclR family transcriptional regulator [Ottowia sp.]MBP8929404.1 IclR family transcriptional regulator [Ottowia sp.]MBP9522676.1 IclR family transcriptional regulator [Ottowia sp.]